MRYPFTTLVAVLRAGALVFQWRQCWAQFGDPISTAAIVTKAGVKPTGVAVVELFTSQGCSSCPSADAILSKIEMAASESKLPIYALSFHVDYWNRLGWNDPYSQAIFTKRQRDYAALGGSQKVYTPQMIVSGRSEFVGSDAAKASAAIAESLHTATPNSVQLQLTRLPNGTTIAVDYKVNGPIDGKVMNLALIQTDVQNSVPRGENSGRTLAHVNVVRAFETLPLTQPTSSVKIKVPEGLSPANVAIVAYVQDRKTAEITGANEAR